MPELPEVETVCRGLAVPLEGRRLAAIEVRRPDLRFPLPADLAARLLGRRVDKISRRAKYIRVFLDNGEVLVAHLGMSGRMTIDRADEGPPPGKHDHVIFITEDGDRVRFCDPRRFGYMDLIPGDALDSHPYFAALGPEPLGDDFTAPSLAAALRTRRRQLKPLLLDQSFVAGLGTTYVDEALFRSGLHPLSLASSVSAPKAARLFVAIRTVLAEAIEREGSSFDTFYRTPTGQPGSYQHQFQVYGRGGEPCRVCGAGIRKIVVGQRGTHFCARCQQRAR